MNPTGIRLLNPFFESQLGSATNYIQLSNILLMNSTGIRLHNPVEF